MTFEGTLSLPVPSVHCVALDSALPDLTAVQAVLVFLTSSRLVPPMPL